MLQELDIIARSYRNPFKQCLVKAVSLEDIYLLRLQLPPSHHPSQAKSPRSGRLRERGRAGASAAAPAQAPHAENQVFSHRVERAIRQVAASASSRVH